MAMGRTARRAFHKRLALLAAGAFVALAVLGCGSRSRQDIEPEETIYSSSPGESRALSEAPVPGDTDPPIIPPPQQAESPATPPPSPTIVYDWEQEGMREFVIETIAQELVSPDGIDIHPQSGLIYVSEEDAWAITRLTPSGAERVIDRDTPIYCTLDYPHSRRDAMRFPEAIKFVPNGDLYVAEDIPGGRLLKFVANETGQYEYGVEIPFPGHWENFAWEGLDISATGELLLAGSDLEHVARHDSIGAFAGVILYRDEEGVWWVPQQRFFASYSSVAFAPSGRQAIYTCEATGEIGWLDLNSQFGLSGHSHVTARSPEGAAILPDGTLMIAEEVGSLLHLDPATDQYRRVVTGLADIESVLWDDTNQRLLVTEDGTGSVLSFSPNYPFTAGADRLSYATYYPAFAEQTIPEECPDYLARILSLGGMRFSGNRPSADKFRNFLQRVPLVAADLAAMPIHKNLNTDDPVERVQFIVFEPNRMMRPGTTDTPHSFALFAVQLESGELITTSVLPVVAGTATAPTTRFTRHGIMPLAVPMPAAVSVSGVGIAAVQFAGMGKTPDFSLVLNPRNPTDSYMVVFHHDGQRDHYHLKSATDQGSRDWVISYRPLEQDLWIRLGPDAIESQEEMQLSQGALP